MEFLGFGKNLQVLRKRKNLSQRELAKELGVTDVTISNLENGKRMPDAYLLVRTAEFFNVSTDNLLKLGGCSAVNELDGSVLKATVTSISIESVETKGKVRIIYDDGVDGVELAVVNNVELANRIERELSGYYKPLGGVLRVESVVSISEEPLAYDDLTNTFRDAVMRGLLPEKSKRKRIISLPVYTKIGKGELGEAYFVYDEEFIPFYNNSEHGNTPISWFVFNAWDNKLVLFADRNNLDFYDDTLELPEYTTVMNSVSISEHTDALNRLHELYDNFKFIVFKELVSEEQFALLIEYRDLLFRFVRFDLRTYYYSLGKEFFDWISTVKVGEAGLPF